jgi:hypothetical protein
LKSRGRIEWEEPLDATVAVRASVRMRRASISERVGTTRSVQKGLRRAKDEDMPEMQED